LATDTASSFVFNLKDFIDLPSKLTPITKLFVLDVSLAMIPAKTGV
jgi:hypothetical protein